MDAQPGVLSHFGALVPGQRAAQVLGSSPIAWAIASRTASAWWPVTGGPCLIFRAARSPAGGRCSSITNRLVRSTRAPIAEPSTREDQVSLPVAGHRAIDGLGGPLADHHLVGHERLAAALGLARGTRSARPVRRHATSSRRSAPRPCT